MSDVVALTAAQAAAAVAKGDLDARELFEAYRERAAADDLNAFVWVADEAPADGAAPAPLGGVPLGVKDLFCTEGVPRRPARRSSRTTGRRTRRPSCASSPRPARRCSARPTRTSSRWARRTRTPPTARCSTRGTARACRAARAAAAPPRSPPASRRGRSAPTPAARSASPPRCAASSASSRRTARVSRYGMIAFASSLDQAGPLTRDVTDAALLFRHMVGRDERDATSVGLPRGGPAAERRAPRRHPPRRARRPHGRGRRARRHGALRGRRWRSPRDARRDRRARLAAARRLRPQRLLRARARPRRPRTSRASTACATGCAATRRRPADDVHEDAPRRLRPRGQAAHPHRHLRAVERLLRRLLRPRAAGADEDRRRLPRAPSSRSTSSSRRRAPASPSSSTRRPTTRSRCTSTTTSPSRSRSPASPAISIPCGLSEGLPVGFQLAGPAFSENRILDAAHALEQAIGFDNPERAHEHDDRSAHRRHLRARHRPRDPRPAQHADEDVLRLRALVRRAAEHAHVRGLPRPARRAAGRQRRGDPLRPDDRARARLRPRAAVDLPPQELLLSRPAEGLPDQPVRRAPLPRRPARRRAHPPRPPRGGRREARPRRRERPHPRQRRRASSTSTAAARRWRRSSPSPTCAPPRSAASGCACCARRCASSASAT